jgi:hypothetical protein
VSTTVKKNVQDEAFVARNVDVNPKRLNLGRYRREHRS